MTPLDRLFAAGQRLFEDLSAGVMSQIEMLLPDMDDDGDKDMDDVFEVMKDVTEVFTVGIVTNCVQADAGTKGAVAVQVPVATAPLPLAPCLAMAIVPGAMPGAPAAQVTCPTEVPSGDGVVQVAIDPAQAPGLYVGHVSDESGNMQRPFLIFLDGLAE